MTSLATSSNDSWNFKNVLNEYNELKKMFLKILKRAIVSNIHFQPEIAKPIAAVLFFLNSETLI